MGDVEGIRIADNHLTEKEIEIEIKPIVYDNIEVTDNMKAALTLQPGFMQYPQIKI